MANEAIPIAENRAERERLRRLVERLGDAELRRPHGPDWTVADALVHVAFWDRRALVLLRKLDKGEELRDLHCDVDSINDPVTYLSKRIPPRAAAEEAVAAAEAIDQALESVTPTVLERFRAAGSPFLLARWEHRREHLDKIEDVLRG